MENKKHDMSGQGDYGKFFMMLAASFVSMYAVMYSNADQFEHIYISLNRIYMTVLMIAPMAVIMLGFMSSMYKNKKLNRLIYVGSVVVFLGAYAMLRTQTLVGDAQFMRSMIPHHSSAILVSQEANLQDPEVKKLAEDIIKAQEREIALMKQILDRID